MGLIPALVLGILSYVALSALAEYKTRLIDAYQVRAKLIETAGELDSSIHAIGRWMWIAYGSAGQVEVKNDFILKSENQIAQFDRTKELYSKLPRNEKIKELFAVVDREWPKAKEGAQETIDLFKKHTDRDNELAKQTMQDKMLPHLVLITKTMTEIKSVMQKLLNKDIESAEVFSTSTIRKVLIISIFSTILCLVFAITLAIYLTRRLTVVSDRLHEASDQVSSASLQSASSSGALSEAATEQAASLEQTATSLEEISSMIAKTLDSAKLTSSCALESQTKAESGREAVSQMMNSMNEINHNNGIFMNQINQSNHQMLDIVKLIQEIGNKTKVINEIVFQTKLLSFNASVEAARAGEQGKGFAVVAEEIGKLAQMSGNSAKDIADMLAQSTAKVEEIVHGTKSKVESMAIEGKQKVEEGVEVAGRCAIVLDEIVENATKVTGYANEILIAGQEQAQGVGEINKAMSQLDIVTQQNAATSLEVASAAKQLSTEAESLRSSVLELVITVNGKESSKSEIKVSKLEWNNRYLLDVDSMDKEHHDIIEKTNSFLEALNQNNLNKTKMAFDSFANLTATHFRNEEKYMEAIAYPELEKHKKMHKGLTSKILDYKGNLEAGNLDKQAIHKFLKNHLIFHMAEQDMKYAEFAQLKIS